MESWLPDFNDDSVDILLSQVDLGVPGPLTSSAKDPGLEARFRTLNAGRSVLSASSSNFPLGVDARLYPPPLDLFDGDSVWPRFRRREVEVEDTDEGSGKDFKELLDTIWGSSMAPRTVDFLLLAVGLVPVERCGRPNAKPIAATPTVPDAQSYQTVDVSRKIWKWP